MSNWEFDHENLTQSENLQNKSKNHKSLGWYKIDSKENQIAK